MVHRSGPQVTLRSTPPVPRLVAFSIPINILSIHDAHDQCAVNAHVGHRHPRTGGGRNTIESWSDSVTQTGEAVLVVAAVRRFPKRGRKHQRAQVGTVSRLIHADKVSVAGAFCFVRHGRSALVLRQSCFDVWHCRPRLCELPYTAEGGCATSDRYFMHQTMLDGALAGNARLRPVLTQLTGARQPLLPAPPCG